MPYESLDSVISALKEYEEYLGQLVERLRKVTDRLRVEDADEWPKKIKKVEERLFSIETKVSTFLSQISLEEKSAYPYLKPLIVRCKNWEEFKSLSSNADVVSFLSEENQKFFQITALKEDKIIIYSGEFPNYIKLLKVWISKELNTENRKVVEGILALE
jgi:hypothetical protein